VAIDLKPAPGGRRHSFRVALRMARRDISRHRGRSLLIVLLIMVPVAGMAGAATLVQSMQETPAERVQHQLGSTQARFRTMGAYNADMVQNPVVETVAGSRNYARDPDFVPRDPKDAIPPGYSVLTESQLTLRVSVGAAEVPLLAKAVDALDPSFTGKYTLLDGRAPAAADEVLVSRGLLERFNLRLGDRLTTSDGTFTAVGKLRDATYSDGNAILFLKPGQQKPQVEGTARGPAPETIYYLVGPDPVTWDQIRELNRVGVAVLSRSVALSPPPRNDAGDVPGTGDDSRFWGGYLAGGLIGALALLEVGLLAGAAFAVGAKRQVRELALLAATGAEAPTVRAVVIAGGLWLGSVAVASGALLGALAAAAVVAVGRHLGSVRFPGFHPDAPLIAAAMGMGLLACLLAAAVPAGQVARQAVLGALKSGRASSAAQRWPARIGVLLLIIAVAALAAGTGLGMVGDAPDVLASRTPLVAGLLIGGAVLTAAALVLLTGGVVAVLTARSGWLPLPARMAAGDAARNRSRTVPAVAAILAAATLASAVMVLAASQFESARQTHPWSARENQAALPLAETGPLLADGSMAPVRVIDPAAVTGALEGALGTVEWTRVLASPVAQNCNMRAGATGSSRPDDGNCLEYKLAVPAGNECPATQQGLVLDAGDSRCQGSMLPLGISGQIPQLIVGGAAELEALLGRKPGRDALEALAGGGMVVSNPVFVKDGQTVLQAYDLRRPVTGPNNRADFEVVSDHSLPAVVESPEVPVPYYGVISADAASRLGIHVEPAALLIQLSGYPSAAELDKASAALAGIYGTQPAALHVEAGADRDSSSVLWLLVGLSALITLSAAGITAGLALADARSDHMTLAGVGAPPRLRKSMAGAQSLMTAGLGTLMGLIAGVVPAVLVTAATRTLAAPVVPWLQLLALLVAVPLSGGALAWLFTRARLPMSRRGVGA
jgi:putative ABC transport system permease protein